MPGAHKGRRTSTRCLSSRGSRPVLRGSLTPAGPRQLQCGNSTAPYDLSEALGPAWEPTSCAWAVGFPRRVRGSRQGSCLRTLMPSRRDTTWRGGVNSWPGSETTLPAPAMRT